MFKLIVVMALYIPTLHAKEYEKPPAFLKDGKINLILKNGKEHKFDSNKWKIVERVKTSKIPTTITKPASESVCIPKTKIQYEERVVEKLVDKIVEVDREVFVYKPNRVSFVLGYGPIGLSINSKGDGEKAYYIKEELGPILGARYVRQFDASWSTGIEYLTSNTVALSVGWGW